MLVDFQLVSHKLLNNEVFVYDSHGDHGLQCGLHAMFQCRLGLATWPLTGFLRPQPQEASKGNAAVSRYSQLAIWIHLAV